MKPLALDLCCGRGGWTAGLLAAGFRVIGFDIRRFSEYPGRFRLCDVLKLTAADVAQADFVIASTPCEQFAVHGMKHFHPNPPYPALGIELFEHVRSICDSAGVAYVMENVQAAQKFIGPAAARAGSFFLWGNAVPAVLPFEKYTKGMTHMPADGRFARRGGVDKFRNRSKRVRAAEAATIPLPLARFVAASAMVRVCPGQSSQISNLKAAL